ncbi:hypothetical protein HanPSC8_Chr09g0362551 [Helianthus annuus]|nr:hypothetical protein HanPSC8_Chr09g0362551 [Helianthus annuus]
MSPFSLNYFQFYTSVVKYMLQIFTDITDITDIYRFLQTITDTFIHGMIS